MPHGLTFEAGESSSNGASFGATGRLVRGGALGKLDVRRVIGRGGEEGNVY